MPFCICGFDSAPSPPPSSGVSPQISSIFQVESCRLQLKKGKKDKSDLEAWEKFKILGSIDINGLPR